MPVNLDMVDIATVPVNLYRKTSPTLRFEPLAWSQLTSADTNNYGSRPEGADPEGTDADGLKAESNARYVQQ